MSGWLWISAAVVSSAVCIGCGATHVAVREPARPVAISCRGGMAFDARVLLGLTVSSAEAFARARGCKLRTVQADGKSLPETSDYDSRRIDVIVRSGVVAGLWARG